MIRPTVPGDTPALLEITATTGVFKPLEIEALREVLDDYYATNRAAGHVAVTCEQDGNILGFAYYAPAAMTERTWYLYWIVVRKERQAGGLGGELLQYVENDIRRRQGRVLFIETSSLRRFYRKHLYEREAVLCDFTRPGITWLVFRKVL